MLEEIRIRDLGVIEEAHLELGPGLSVLTGETGAGKTMVLTALAMVLGEKVDTSLVRTDADRAVSAARFAAAPALLAEAEADHGADVAEGLVLARMLSAEGRTRSLLGGASVPAGVLATFGESLISVHGQGSANRLLRPTSQRDLLDDFAGAETITLRERHRALHQRAKEMDRQIEELTGNREAAEREALGLRELITAWEKVAPSSGEVTALRAEIERLAHADALTTAAGLARTALAGEEDGVSADSLLASARRALDPQRTIDPEIQRLLNEVIEIAVRVEEVNQELARYLDSIDIDPRRLQEAHTRLGEVQALLRRFDVDTDDTGIEALASRYSAAGLRLLDLEGGDARLEQLREERAVLDTERAGVADALSAHRMLAASRLGEAVTSEIHALAMPHTEFSVQVVRGSHGPAGWDEIEFCIAAAQSAPVAVAKGASGGELSRIMLALEVSLAQAGPVATYVFDEVDAGVGGSAAIEVGRRLQRLARHAQVIVVTHLAQVAAFADAHFTVTKDSDGRVTSSTVRRLQEGERAAELARMMAGLADSERAQASGAELLALAAAARNH